MYKSILLLAFGFLFAIPDSANAQAEIRKQITLKLQEQASCWSEGDLNCYMQTYKQDDSTSFIGSKGIIFGWGAIKEYYQQAYPDPSKMGKLQLGTEKFNICSNTSAQVIGTWTLTNGSDIRTGFFTLMFEKDRNGWVIVSDMSNETK